MIFSDYGDFRAFFIWILVRSSTMAPIDALNSRLKGDQNAMDLGVQGLKPVHDDVVRQIQAAASAMASEHELDPMAGSVRNLEAPIPTPTKHQNRGQRTLHGLGNVERKV